MEKLLITYQGKFIKIKWEGEKETDFDLQYYTLKEKAVIREMMEGFLMHKDVKTMCLALANKTSKVYKLLHIDEYESLSSDELSELLKSYKTKKLIVKCTDDSIIKTEVFNKDWIKRIKKNYYRPMLTESNHQLSKKY